MREYKKLRFPFDLKDDDFVQKFMVAAVIEASSVNRRWKRPKIVLILGHEPIKEWLLETHCKICNSDTTDKCLMYIDSKEQLKKIPFSTTEDPIYRGA